ncbi:TPA: FkbM family methyltransferase [Campylobacter jejuni]|uniref:FkbM family methyltransferase n=1 Tax=Campylobacter jejuni TaxID=197 RepID=UPI001374F406|nr:FkbM family methyltransferase [Campylobacter jejuni]
MLGWIKKKIKRLNLSLKHKQERWKTKILLRKLYLHYRKTHIIGASFSQYGQDLFIKTFFNYKPQKEEYFFVDIGANDGFALSNTYGLEKDLVQKWKGILIEADPDIFQECIKNRPNTPKYNVALCNTDGEVEFMQIQGPQMLSGIVSEYSQEHLERIYREIEECNGSYEIIKLQGAKFSTIMKNFPEVREIDYLSIDVEGGEMAILKSIDFDQHKILVIGIEDNYPETSGIEKFLCEKGYKKIARLGCDSFFELKMA